MFPNEASYNYDWTGESKLSYGDFLRAKQFERSLRYAIDDQTKQLVATNEQLAERGINILSEDINRGFSELSENIVAVQSAVRETGAEIVKTLNWGFGEILLSLKRMNDSLAELVRLSQTPSQVWAYEQFENARDEFRRDLYPEALESITRAILGHGSNLGYKTEFRFHFLQATILLGDHKNCEDKIIDLPHAEQAFLTSARYARSDFPIEAGSALIGAGRAAYVQSRFRDAIQHLVQGLELAPTNSDGMYLLARACFANSQFEDASAWLLEAILLNAGHAISASGDADFLSKEDFLKEVLQAALESLSKRSERLSKRLEITIGYMNSFTFGGYAAAILIADRRSEIYEAAKDVEKEPATLVGLEIRIKRRLNLLGQFPKYFEDFRARFIANQTNTLVKHPTTKRKNYCATELMSNAGMLLMLFGFVFAISTVIWGNVPGHGSGSHDGLETALVVSALALFLFLLNWALTNRDADNDERWRAALRDEISVMKAMRCPSEWKISDVS